MADGPLGRLFWRAADDLDSGQVEFRPVLLLHGIGANSLHWRYQLAGLADRFRLIAWNAPDIC